jgi:hypothetical protein
MERVVQRERGSLWRELYRERGDRYGEGCIEREGIIVKRVV